MAPRRHFQLLGAHFTLETSLIPLPILPAYPLAMPPPLPPTFFTHAQAAAEVQRLTSQCSLLTHDVGNLSYELHVSYPPPSPPPSPPFHSLPAKKTPSLHPCSVILLSLADPPPPHYVLTTSQVLSAGRTAPRLPPQQASTPSSAPINNLVSFSPIPPPLETSSFPPPPTPPVSRRLDAGPPPPPSSLLQLDNPLSVFVALHLSPVFSSFFLPASYPFSPHLSSELDAEVTATPPPHSPTPSSSSAHKSSCKGLWELQDRIDARRSSAPPPSSSNLLPPPQLPNTGHLILGKLYPSAPPFDR
jgi:hypothetical protein